MLPNGSITKNRSKAAEKMVIIQFPIKNILLSCKNGYRHISE